MKRAARLTLVLLLMMAWGGQVALAAEPPVDLTLVEEVLALIEDTYWQDVDRTQLLKGAVAGMLQALGDPYSEYFTPEEFALFQQIVNSEQTGVGIVVVRVEDEWVVDSVLAGSPAERLGLQGGDVLLSVDEQPVADLSLEALLALLQGEEDSLLELMVQRAGEQLVFVMRREIIWQPTVEHRTLPGNIGYIRILSFGEKTADEFGQALRALQKKRVKALVLDLRDNPGGLLQAATDVAQQLLPAGPVVRVVYGNGQEEVVATTTPGAGLPTAVLVNELTASAAEVLAAAIQEQGQGLLLGTPTFAKGIMQEIYELGAERELGAIKLTTAYLETPQGMPIHQVGLQPDVLITPATQELPLLTAEQTLYPGLEGEAVQLLQQALLQLGLYEEEINGVYTEETQAAVLAAQELSGDVMADGVADGWTQMEINNLMLQQAWSESELQLFNHAQAWLQMQTAEPLIGRSEEPSVSMARKAG